MRAAIARVSSFGRGPLQLPGDPVATFSNERMVELPHAAAPWPVAAESLLSRRTGRSNRTASSILTAQSYFGPSPHFLGPPSHLQALMP